MTNLRPTIINWLPIGVLIVLFSLMSYMNIQQSYRQSADDPQVQLAEDISRTLSKGGAPGSGISLPQIDISESLSPFVIVYDAQLKPLAYTGTLHGNVPKPPDGVFEEARENQENRLTWEPEENVRIATVIRPYKNEAIEGFVLAGRSLREVESRESELTLRVLLFFIVSLIVTFAAVHFSKWI